MRHGSLFSGIGGFDLAAEWMGWENVFHCEWEDFPRKVLEHYWPKAISYGDIKETDFTIHRGNIDLISGGFPCQPYSQAGKRKGKDDERHLWPEMLRAIREIQPSWIVGENVFGLINWNGGMVFDEVQTDLETEGYKVWAYVLPACAVNAPHRRDRVWFVAHSNKRDDRRASRKDEREGGEKRIQQRDKVRESFEPNKVLEPSADPESTRSTISELGKEKDRLQIQTRSNIDRPKGLGDASYTQISRGKRQCEQGQGKIQPYGRGSTDIPSSWQDFPTQSPICSRDDGISDRLDGITFPKWRNESIKAYGNAVVPQVVYQIFKSIAEYEKQNY